MKKHYVPKKIDISKIIVDPFNPPRRLKRIELRALANDIKENGLLDELKVRKPFKGEKKGYYYLFEGHRRLQALKMLKETKADCFVYTLENKEEAERIYNSINSTSMKMDSAQYAWRWVNGCTIPQKHLNDIIKLADWFGNCKQQTIKDKKFKKQIKDHCTGISPRAHVLVVESFLKYLNTYTGNNSNPSNKKILNASFKDHVIRSWKNSLMGKKAEKPISRKRVIERINSIK